MKKIKAFFSARPKAKWAALGVIAALILAAAAIVIIPRLGPAPETLPEVDALQPVFADPFPDGLEPAASLVKQKLVLLGTDSRYHTAPLEENWACDAVTGELEDALQKSIVSRFEEFAEDRSAPVTAADTTADALLQQLLKAGLPQTPESHTAEKTAEGIFRISLSYNAETLRSVFPEAGATVSGMLEPVFGEIVKGAAPKAEPAGLDIAAEINGYNGLISKLTLTLRFQCAADGAFTEAYAADEKGSFTCFISRGFSYGVSREGVLVSQKTVRMKQNARADLGYTVNLPQAEEKDYTVTFASSDPAVLTVDENGRMEGVAVSPESVLVTVTVKYLDQVYFDMCEVYVTVPVKSVAVSAAALTMTVGGEETLQATLQPEDATIKDIVWASGDESVAVVDDTGKVTAVGPGVCKIFAISKDGQKSASCEITVQDAAK